MNKDSYIPVLLPLEEGETTQLRLSEKYFHIAGNREPSVDWAAIPEMIRLVEDSDIRGWWKEEALGHLHDASNDALDERRRMHHFDVAGSRIWEGSTTQYGCMGYYARNLGPLMRLFKDAGGQ